MKFRQHLIEGYVRRTVVCYPNVPASLIRLRRTSTSIHDFDVPQILYFNPKLVAS